MRHLIALSLIALCISVLMFQNCSQPFHQEGSSMNLSLMYPYYSQKPDYFDNVQLTAVLQDGDIWRYQFVASVVSIETPEADIDVDIQIHDQHNAIICPRFTATVKNTNNHLEIPDCTSAKKISEAKIDVRAKLTTESTFQLINTYEFDL